MRVDKLNHLTGLLNAALISSVLAVPLVFDELRYASQSDSKLPYLLFAILWLLPTALSSRWHRSCERSVRGIAC